jgi:hypothetical protein
MFAQPTQQQEEDAPVTTVPVQSKYKNLIQPTPASYGEINYAEIEEMLEKEKQQNNFKDQLMPVVCLMC